MVDLRPGEIKSEVEKIVSTIVNVEERKRRLLSLLEAYPDDGYILLNLATTIRLAGNPRDMDMAIRYATKARELFWDERYRRQADLEIAKLKEFSTARSLGKLRTDANGMDKEVFGVDKDLLGRVTDNSSTVYVDLTELYRQFEYPVSLDLAKLAGRSGYARGHLDPLEFLVLIWTKMYNNINSVEDSSRIASLFYQERDEIRPRSNQLIEAVKKYEIGRDSAALANEIENFSLNTANVRLPVASFILRMLRPDLFGTIDVRALSALRKIGFKGTKTLPASQLDKEDYLRAFSGIDYLRYNSLLTNIGAKYKFADRIMWPSEVDMALYEYDKRN